jgi:hypothetical protein
LHLLLIDGLLGQAWRAAGFQKQPVILAPRLEAYLEADTNSSILNAMAGGGTYEDVECMFAIFQKGAELTPAPGPPDVIGFYPFKLSSYLESIGLVLAGRRIKRREVVKYVSNKLGGKHFDTRRSPGDPYVHLDRYGEAFDIGGKKAIYFELLSIGQRVVRSPDVQELRNRI